MVDEIFRKGNITKRKYVRIVFEYIKETLKIVENIEGKMRKKNESKASK